MTHMDAVSLLVQPISTPESHEWETVRNSIWSTFNYSSWRNSGSSNNLHVDYKRNGMHIGLVTTVSNVSTGSKFEPCRTYTGGMVRWLKKSSKDVNNT